MKSTAHLYRLHLNYVRWVFPLTDSYGFLKSREAVMSKRLLTGTWAEHVVHFPHQQRTKNNTNHQYNMLKPQENYTDPDLKYTASNKQTCRQRYQYKATTIPSLSPHLSCKVASVQKKKWAKKTFRGKKKKIYFIPHRKRTAKHSYRVMEVEKLLGIIKQRNPSWRNCPPQADTYGSLFSVICLINWQ